MPVEFACPSLHLPAKQNAPANLHQEEIWPASATVLRGYPSEELRTESARRLARQRAAVAASVRCSFSNAALTSSHSLQVGTSDGARCGSGGGGGCFKLCCSIAVMEAAVPPEHRSPQPVTPSESYHTTPQQNSKPLRGHTHESSVHTARRHNSRATLHKAWRSKPGEVRRGAAWRGGKMKNVPAVPHIRACCPAALRAARNIPARLLAATAPPRAYATHIQ